MVSDLESALSVRVTKVEADEREEDERYLTEPEDGFRGGWMPGMLEGGNGMEDGEREDNDRDASVVEQPLIMISSEDEGMESEEEGGEEDNTNDDDGDGGDDRGRKRTSMRMKRNPSKVDGKAPSRHNNRLDTQTV